MTLASAFPVAWSLFRFDGIEAVSFGAMRSIEPGISRFPDAQLRI